MDFGDMKSKGFHPMEQDMVIMSWHVYTFAPAAGALPGGKM